MAILRLEKTSHGRGVSGTTPLLNQSRDTVPIELSEKGVSLPVWQSTCDGFLGWHTYTEANGGMTYLLVSAGGGTNQSIFSGFGIALIVMAFLLYPPFIVVGLILLVLVLCIDSCSGNQGATRIAVLTFSYFLRNQQKVYAPYNIRVISDGPPRLPVLIFDTSGIQYKAPSSMDINNGVPSMAVKAGPSLAQELTSLHDLHVAGALSDEEYTCAKERVIFNNNYILENPGASASTTIHGII